MDDKKVSLENIVYQKEPLVIPEPQRLVHTPTLFKDTVNIKQERNYQSDKQEGSFTYKKTKYHPITGNRTSEEEYSGSLSSVFSQASNKETLQEVDGVVDIVNTSLGGLTGGLRKIFEIFTGGSK